VPRPLLALVGPTASGKTEAGVALAGTLGAEILSVDSMLVYRGMDVGTAKPTADQRRSVAHHVLDVVEPTEPFSVARYQHLAREALDGIDRRGARALLVGGSGLYLRSVVDDLEFPGTDPGMRGDLERQAEALGAESMHRRLVSADPQAASRIGPGNVRRTVRALEVAAVTGRRFSSFARAWEEYPAGRMHAVGIDIEREVLARRIHLRVATMLEAGLLEEVGALMARGLGGWLTSSQAIGYAEIARHLQGRLSLRDAVEATERRTSGLARRQMAWFRRDPRIRWVPAGEGGAIEVLDELLSELEAG
jgi:tRNA dimethylallyltransferase